jgi:hypothetical protein
LGIGLILILQAHIANFGSQSSPFSYAQQTSPPPPSLQTVDPVQAEQDASRLADAFRHAFVGDMDEDEDGAGDEVNEDQEEDKDQEEDEEDGDEDEIDVDDPVRADRTSAKAWVSNGHPYGYCHCLCMQM